MDSLISANGRVYSQKPDAVKMREWLTKNPEKRRRHLVYTRAWKKRNPDKIRAQKTSWMAIPINRIKHSLGQAKRRANKYGIPFTITVDDLRPIPLLCPVLGIEINYNGTGAARGFVDTSPSIDRMIPALGYVPGNVRIISFRANRIKCDATVEEIRSILKYMQLCN